MGNRAKFLAIEQNLVSKFCYIPPILGYNVKEENGIKIINCHLKTSMFNIACDAKFSDTALNKSVDYVMSQYKNNPFAWWVGPSDMPTSLKNAILNAGLEKETQEHAMFYALSDSFQKHKLDESIIIRQVSDLKTLQDFVSIISAYDLHVHEFLNNKQIISDRVKNKNPMFVSYISEQPVGIGALHFSNNVAGIYDIITPENLRGKGIGTNIMKFLINYAYQKNISNICLSASSDSGFRIYEKLGFEKVGAFDCYEWKGKK